MVALSCVTFMFIDCLHEDDSKLNMSKQVFGLVFKSDAEHNMLAVELVELYTDPTGWPLFITALLQRM